MFVKVTKLSIEMTELGFKIGDELRVYATKIGQGKRVYLVDCKKLGTRVNLTEDYVEEV